MRFIPILEQAWEYSLTLRWLPTNDACLCICLVMRKHGCFSLSLRQLRTIDACVLCLRMCHACNEKAWVFSLSLRQLLTFDAFLFVYHDVLITFVLTSRHVHTERNELEDARGSRRRCVSSPTYVFFFFYFLLSLLMTINRLCVRNGKWEWWLSYVVYVF